jgi:formate/nitrite transporter FocA (FNT family)
LAIGLEHLGIFNDARNGQLLGGSIMVAAVYWFVYLRKGTAKVISG